MDLSRDMSQIFYDPSPQNAKKSVKNTELPQQKIIKKRKVGSPSNLYERMAG